MDTPLLNFVAAIGIGLVIGIVGGFVLRGRSSSAMWMAPVLAVVGALIASGLAAMFGDRSDYGYKEGALQVVLAVVGVVVAYLLTGRGAAKA
jgi:uncharacterized membrane protein YeaQ/YmgE (transglycosylase-associated protein family)